MQQSSSFELSWSNLIDLWNESSYEKGADLSFKEIVILESFAEEGVEPCQGFDWLPVAKLAEPVKPKKRTISYSFGKYTAHVAQAPKASLETLNLLMENNLDEKAFASIALIATAEQFLGKLPEHWRGWNYRFLQKIEECHRSESDRLSYSLPWYHSSKWLFPKGFYSKGLVNATSRLNASRVVELALCNLLYYLDSYRPCYYLRAGVDDVSRFEAVAAEMGVRAILREAKVSGSACGRNVSKKRQVERIEDEIEDYDKGVRHREGRMVERRSVAYERSPQARRACLRHYGCKCSICGIDFGKEFGEEFSGVIEVHHLEPLSLSKGEREIDPIKDLVPLCPNCHKMVHRKAGKPYTLEQIRALRRTSLD